MKTIRRSGRWRQGFVRQLEKGHCGGSEQAGIMQCSEVLTVLWQVDGSKETRISLDDVYISGDTKHKWI